MPEPVTVSVTVRETSTSLGPAIALTRQPEPLSLCDGFVCLSRQRGRRRVGCSRSWKPTSRPASGRLYTSSKTPPRLSKCSKASTQSTSIVARCPARPGRSSSSLLERPTGSGSATSPVENSTSISRQPWWAIDDLSDATRSGRVDPEVLSEIARRHSMEVLGPIQVGYAQRLTGTPPAASSPTEPSRAIQDSWKPPSRRP
jgi:hypothetical protein